MGTVHSHSVSTTERKLVSTFRINCLNYSVNAKAHFYWGDNSCPQAFLLLHTVPHNTLLFTGQAAGTQTPAPHGDGLDLPLVSGYSRSEEPGVKGRSKQEKSRQRFWGAHCFPFQAMGLSSLASDGLLRTLSIRVTTGLFQSPLKSREVFPLMSVGHVLCKAGHQAAELNRGKLPGGECMNTNQTVL